MYGIGSNFFISGTDTGVGKTITAVALGLALEKQGVKVGLLKPVQTGGAEDIHFYRKFFKRESCAMTYCFEPACSPHLAAEMVNEKISLEKMEENYTLLAARHDVVLVEGAGGILVPLNSSFFIKDFMVRLNLPVILVARSGLGTLNHSLQSLALLQQSGLKPRVIFTDSKEKKWSFIEKDNVKILKQHAPYLGHIPFLKNVTPDLLCKAGENLLSEL